MTSQLQNEQLNISEKSSSPRINEINKHSNQHLGLDETQTDQEHFFHPMNQSTGIINPINQQIDYFVYKHSSYVIIQGNVPSMLNIYQEKSHDSTNKDDYLMVEQIHIVVPDTTKNIDVKEINKVIVFDELAKNSVQCYIAILTNQNVVEAKNNIFYAEFNPGQDTVNHIAKQFKNSAKQHYSALDVVPSKKGDDDIMDTLVVHAVSDKEKWNLIFWSINVDKYDDLTISNFSDYSCSFSPNAEKLIKGLQITNISKDNYVSDESKFESKSDLLFISFSLLPENVKKDSNELFFGFSSEDSSQDTIKFYSFDKLINISTDESQNNRICSIKVDFQDNIWFSASNDQKQYYLYLLDTTPKKRAIINQHKGFFSLAELINKDGCIKKGDLYSLFWVQPIRPLTSQYGFEVANIINRDYSYSYSIFEEAKQNALLLNVASTVYMFVRSKKNINNVLLEADNLARKRNLTPNASTSYINLDSWTVIDNFQKGNLFTSGIKISVMQQQLFYSLNTNKVQFGLLPNNKGLNNTAIFAWIQQYSSQNINKSVKPNEEGIKFLTWRFSAIDDIFTAKNNYSNWKKANDSFHADDLDLNGVGHSFFSADCKTRNCNPYLIQWQNFSDDDNKQKQKAETNYFLASGPFSVCCDMSLNPKHQKIQYYQESGKKMSEGDINTKLSMIDGGSIINFSSGNAYKNIHYYSASKNAMTRKNDNIQITINGYSKTEISIGITAINFPMLNSNNFSFFSNKKKSINNNLGEDTLIRFFISPNNFIDKRQNYFSHYDTSAGFYCFLNQKSLNLNFNSQIFKNNALLNTAHHSDIAKIVSINEIIKNGKNLTFVLPKTVNNDVKTATVGDNWELKNSQTQNYATNQHSISSNTHVEGTNGKFIKNLNLGLFIVMIKPISINTNVNSNTVFLLIQVGGTSVIYGQNIHYINLFDINRKFNFSVVIWGFVFLAAVMIAYIVFLRLTKIQFFSIVKSRKSATLALTYTYHKANKSKKTKDFNNKITDRDSDSIDFSRKNDSQDDIPTLSSFFDDD